MTDTDPKADSVPADKLPKDVFDDPTAVENASQAVDPLEGSVS